MNVKLILAVGDEYLWRMIDLPFVPTTGMWIELAASSDQAEWTCVEVTAVTWHVVDSQFACDCYIPMCEVDVEFLQACGWVPLD